MVKSPQGFGDQVTIDKCITVSAIKTLHFLIFRPHDTASKLDKFDNTQQLLASYCMTSIVPLFQIASELPGILQLLPSSVLTPDSLEHGSGDVGLRASGMLYENEK